MKAYLLRNRNWLLIGVETVFIGAALLGVYLMFDDQLPFLFEKAELPFLSVVMIILGIIIIAKLKKIRLWMFIVSCAVWSYIGFSFGLEVLDPQSPYLIIPLCLSIFSFIIVARILLEAGARNPIKREKKERSSNEQ